MDKKKFLDKEEHKYLLKLKGKKFDEEEKLQQEKRI